MWPYAIIILWNRYSLGQGSLLHDWVSSAGPTQSAPSCWGTGLLQSRFLACCPPPHVLSHSPQGCQGDQLPSTKTWRRSYFTIKSQLSWVLWQANNSYDVCSHRASDDGKCWCHLWGKPRKIVVIILKLKVWFGSCTMLKHCTDLYNFTTTIYVTYFFNIHPSITILSNRYLLGQGSLLHDWVSSAGPTQSAPPFWGAGLLQSRFLACCPPPHVLSHSPQGCQGDQLPSTKRWGRIYVQRP